MKEKKHKMCERSNYIMWYDTSYRIEEYYIKCQQFCVWNKHILFQVNGYLFMFVYGVECHFQQYFYYIVAFSFIDGGNQRKPWICRKSLTNFITYCCIEYTSPWGENHRPVVSHWQTLSHNVEENHRPVASHWQTLSHNVVHLALIEKTTDLSQVTDKLYHIMLQNHRPVASHW